MPAKKSESQPAEPEYVSDELEKPTSTAPASTKWYGFTTPPATASFQVRSPAGFVVTFNLADEDEYALLERVDAFENMLSSVEFVYDDVFVNRPVDNAPKGAPITPQQTPAPPPTFQGAPAGLVPGGGQQSAPPPPQQQNGSFPAASLKATVLSGNVYWSVVSEQPPYHIHGIRIWPEVLQEAGLEPSAIDPNVQHPMTGWTAFWGVDNRGKKKVTRLVYQQ